MLRKIPVGRLTKQKMMTVNDIVHSQLFLYPECRKIMLPVFTEQIKILLETNEEVRHFNIFISFNLGHVDANVSSII